MMLCPALPSIQAEITLPKKTATELQKLAKQLEGLGPLAADASSERFAREIELRRAALECCGGKDGIDQVFQDAVQAISDECGRIETELREQAAELEMPAGLVNRELYSDLNFRLARDKNRRIRDLQQGFIEWRRNAERAIYVLEDRLPNVKRRERFHAHGNQPEPRPPVSGANKSVPMFGPENRDDPMGRAGKLIEQRGGAVAVD